jgi:hypothetical protein
VTAAEMLAAWHWQGPLGETLVVTYMPVHHVQVPIDSMLEAVSMMPSDQDWRDTTFLHVTVRLPMGLPDPPRTFYVPESADMQAVAQRIMLEATGLLLGLLVHDARMTFAAGPDSPAKNFFDPERAEPLTVQGLDTLGWTGP